MTRPSKYKKFELGILKCISTDTIRQVMRSFVTEPALHRSSYDGDEDPIKNWMECCEILRPGIMSVVDDSIKRGTSLILEGVHIIPSDEIIAKWEASGGIAIGSVLTIPDAEVHKTVIERRGELLKKRADNQLRAISRIRKIHDEMLRLGKLHNWLIIEQRPRLTPSPLALVQNTLNSRYLEGNFELKQNSKTDSNKS
jgi:2-phosphoglycerate kinase